MAQYPNLYNVELTKGPAVVQLQQMFLGDVKANRIGAIVTENGEAVTLGGTCSGTAILSNGGTVSISGTVSGNTCYIDLPSGVYAVEGPVSIFLNNVSGGNTTTLVAAFGNVCKTQTGTVIDPGTIIPSVSALIDSIDTAVASIPADYTALLAAVAPTFSSSTAYTAGRYVWYSGNLYRFTADHAAGTWTGTDAVQVVVTNEIADLKSALNYHRDELFRLGGKHFCDFVKGRQRYVSNGAEAFANNARWISMAQGTYFEFKQGDKIVSNGQRYHFRICYSTDNGSTWIMTDEQITTYTVATDCIGWIDVITTDTATDADVKNVMLGVVEIIRVGTNITKENAVNISGIMEAVSIDPYANYEIKDIKNGVIYSYVNTTATEIGNTTKIIEIAATKGDEFKFKFNIEPNYHPEYFSDYYFIIREIGTNEASPLRNVTYHLSDANVADFTVYYANTTKIIANINLARSSTPVSGAYNEKVNYTVTAIKINEHDDIYTEAGDTWEV